MEPKGSSLCLSASVVKIVFFHSISGFALEFLHFGLTTTPAPRVPPLLI